MVAPRGQTSGNRPADLAELLGPHLDAAYCCARLLGCSELEAAVVVDEASLDLVADLRTVTTRAADPVAGLLRRTWLLARQVRTDPHPPALAQLTDRQVLLVVLADHFQLPEATVAAAAGLVGLIAELELRRARRVLLGLPEESPVAEPYPTRVLPAGSPTTRQPKAPEPAPREPLELAAAAAGALAAALAALAEPATGAAATATAPGLTGARLSLPDPDRAQVLGHLAGHPVTPGPARSTALEGLADVATPATTVLAPVRAPVAPAPGAATRRGAGATWGPRRWVVVTALVFAALLGAGAGALFRARPAAQAHTAVQAPAGSTSVPGHAAGRRSPRPAHPATTTRSAPPPANSASAPSSAPASTQPTTRPAAAQQQVPAAQPQIFLAPASGPEGTLITVTGTGWAPGSTVHLSYETLLGVTGASAQARVSAAGSFRAYLRASDPTHLAGRHTVNAVDGSASASATFVATT